MCVFENKNRRLENAEYLGYEYEITHNELGARCGYVRILPGHPWFGKNLTELNQVRAHGSITYAHPGVVCDTHDELAEWWIGFDCSHPGDAFDASLPIAAPPEFTKILQDMSNIFKSTIRSTDYVREHCKSIIRQARVAAKSKKVK